MIKYIFTLTVLVLITSAFFLSSLEKDLPESIELSTVDNSTSPAIVVDNPSNPDTVEIPDEITSPSSVGEVIFPHLFHYKDLEYECVECHHEINAAKLVTPHEKYFKDFWIDCSICHNGNETAKMQAQGCSECHHTHPYGIADETLSAKVVIHKNCWECHEVETGIAASESCEMCHSGERKKS